MSFGNEPTPLLGKVLVTPTMSHSVVCGTEVQEVRAPPGECLLQRGHSIQPYGTGVLPHGPQLGAVTDEGTGILHGWALLGSSSRPDHKVWSLWNVLWKGML